MYYNYCPSAARETWSKKKGFGESETYVMPSAGGMWTVQENSQSGFVEWLQAACKRFYIRNLFF